MESSNLHSHQHHELQDQFVGSSPLQNPSFYGVGTTHAWPPMTTLNSSHLDPHIIINSNSNSRSSRQQNDILVPPLNSPMIQDLGFHWDSNKGTFTNLSNHDLHHHLGRVKEELTLSDSYTKMINSASNIEDFHLNPTTYLKNEHINLNDQSDEKLLLRNFSSSAGEYYFNAQQNFSSRVNFSQIFPTVNISDLNQSMSRPLDMNLEALDLFNSSRLCGNYLSQPQKHIGLFKESLSYGIEDHMHQPTHRPSNSPSKISPFTNGVAEAKRPSTLLESKAPQAATKKSRVESRTPCPPFKVRKEKLGDRIAALQQMVAPFGKTDTASVLMEAIGYIKFLQNQVETLSVPYMKLSSNKASRTTLKGGSTEEGSAEPTRDLRSRGLCLVPLTCLSYVTDSGGIWSPPNFGAGT